MTINERMEALKMFLDGEVESIEDMEQGYDEEIIEVNGQEYLVLTDEEADEKAEEYIKNSLWAFNASFIIENSSVDYSPQLEIALQKVQSELCEGANELVEAIIDDVEDFAYAAIQADGRGHFLSFYDGEENEVDFEDEDGFIETIYIYRTN